MVHLPSYDTHACLIDSSMHADVRHRGRIRTAESGVRILGLTSDGSFCIMSGVNFLAGMATMPRRSVKLAASSIGCGEMTVTKFSCLICICHFFDTG